MSNINEVMFFAAEQQKGITYSLARGQVAPNGSLGVHQPHPALGLARDHVDLSVGVGGLEEPHAIVVFTYKHA